MDLLDWGALGLRWFHVIAGIGWIGSSLYFMWLDAQIEPPSPPRPGVEGELWMVHSGGFYLAQKHRLAPGALPPVLHWFKWEAALTAMSGFALLTAVYYVGSSGSLLVDPSVSPIGRGVATAVGIGLFVAGWTVYDLIWVSSLGRDHEGAANVLCVALLAAVVWGLCRLLSGRAAFLHVGGMLGILMALNVWVRILPAQRELIAATLGGREQDPVPGRRAKQRSTHNSYVTFPVILMMLSAHHPGLWGHPWNWLLLWLLIAVGMAVRHAMIAREHRRPADWALAPAVVALAIAVYVAGVPARPPAAAVPERVSFAAARRIVELRCTACHSSQPSDDVFQAAPNGVTFDTPEAIRARAALIRERTVATQTMPLANKTGMTERERAMLGRWIDQGAPLD